MTSGTLISDRVESSYPPEACPFNAVVVDVTHRCNMTCHNCYIPNRHIPDLDAAWLVRIFARLPPRRMIRFAGAEATLREDLCDLIRQARAHGHHTCLMTNGLKLADRAYVRRLKAAGLQVVYLSMNGGFDDELYFAIDGMRCAEKKARALDNLTRESVYTSAGMILVRGVNEHELPRLIGALRPRRSVRQLKLRSIGAMGRFMTNPPYSLSDLLRIFSSAAGVDPESLPTTSRTATTLDLRYGRWHVQLTEWPDLSSGDRGRLTPEGLVAQFMEHVIANDGGY